MTNIALQLLVLFIVVAVAAAWLFRGGKKADAARAARFSDREDLVIADWELRFYPGEQLDSTRLRKGLREVAAAVDVPVGKLRPSDRFDIELAPTKGWEADDATALLSRLLPGHVDTEKTGKIRTVDEFLRAIVLKDER